MNKRQYLIIALTFVSCLLASAQSKQSGYVKEYNDKQAKTALAGVELQVSGAGTAVSAKDGAFTLQFSRLKVGDRVSLNRAIKDGYEVFNKEAVEQWNISGEEKPFTVVMCRSDKFRALCDMYSRVSHESYKRQQALDEARLEKELKAGRLKEAEYKQQLYDLRQSYAKQLENIDSYVEKFARIDLSELSQTEQAIIDKVQAGDMEGTIAEYEKQDFAKLYVNEKKDLESLKKAKEQLAEMERRKEAERDSIYNMTYRQVHLYNLAGGKQKLDKARDLRKAIADADSTYSIASWDYASLARMRGDYDESLKYFFQAYRHEDRDMMRDLLLSSIGFTYFQLNDYDKCVKYFQEAYNKIKQWENCNKEFQIKELADVCSTLAMVYNNSSDYENAAEYYKRELDYLNAIIDPANLDADVYTRIIDAYLGQGMLNCNIGNYVEGKIMYDKAESMIDLYSGEEDFSTVKYTLYHNLYDYYQFQGLYNEANISLQKYMSIIEPLYTKDPYFYTRNYAISFDNQCKLYTKWGKFDDAEKSGMKAVGIFEDLCNDYFLPYASEYILSLQHMGDLYKKMYRYDDALRYYEQARIQVIKLIEAEDTHSSRGTYAGILTSLASVYIHTEDYSKSIQLYTSAIDLYKDLNVRYKNSESPNLRITHQSLGQIFAQAGQYAEALDQLNCARAIQPSKMGSQYYVNSEANIEGAYGYVYMKMDEYEEAEKHLEKSIQLYEQLMETDSLAYLEAYLSRIREISIIYGAWDKWEKKEKYVLKKLQIYEGLYRNYPDVFRKEYVSALRDTGDTYLMMKDFKSYLKYTLLWLEQEEALYKEGLLDDNEYAEALMKTASAYSVDGQTDKDETYLKKAFEIAPTYKVVLQ